MSTRRSKLGELVRFREFREGQAKDALHVQARELRRASDAHGEAASLVEEVAAWKMRAANPGHIDLDMYEFGLFHEHVAVEACDAAKEALEECRRDAEQGCVQWRDAMSATRVVRERAEAQKHAAVAIEEKRAFDQLSDLLLSKWGASE